MNNKGIDRDELFREILSAYLRSDIAAIEFEDRDHLDGDTIAAFVEGNLSEREARPVNSHLVDCSFCRHRSAELIRLDLEFAEESAKAPEAKPAPTKVSDVLSGILGKILGAGEGAVFAHQEDETKEEEDRKDDRGESE
ncbi:MAG: hypothetical protein IPM63_08800 [Acidobacteriota bacterium]|nr:MAG: hypothetical protein IPM63_08800 [Acidobacteriota bacterium]